ncbi:hypothetical protein Pryu01_03003 [Paraliobacillus ryukyuensis]|uniref:Protein gp8 n=1 Tax=Paraliobacillus ryukyuensis TaxID=200904 RepID=A0A366DQ82_9BACI|nr:hypothetical protein [Paraliobacillus ryukyuensis]RBO92065.1 hypothetical protein DES48_11729 [Paraliobacillus ryukyuensis]
MPYIDYTYYTDEFQGEEVDEQTFNKYVRRASDLIDQVTNYVIAKYQFENLAAFIQDQVKKATAAQIEFYVVKGNPAELDAGEGVSNVSIGSFSYQEGNNNQSSKQANRISPNALEYLRTTGLLYRGLDVVHRAYY